MACDVDRFPNACLCAKVTYKTCKLPARAYTVEMRDLAKKMNKKLYFANGLSH
jgi:hypothetical protein